MKTLCISAIIVALSGCAKLHVERPQVHDFENSRSYSASFDDVWLKAVSWFADHNVVIDKIEKSSGLITAKYRLRTSEKHLDCGNYKASGLLGKADFQRSAALNVTVRSVDTSTTKVTVNVFGEYLLQGQDSWDGRTVKQSGECVSTGELERSIFGAIERK